MSEAPESLVQDPERDKKIAYLREISGIPSAYFDYHARDYIGKGSSETLAAIRGILNDPQEFINEGYFLYFYGKNNTQKTSMACFFLRNLLLQNFTGHYVTMKSLYDSLRNDDFRDAGEAKGQVAMYRDCDVLVVDEAFDKRKLYISGKTTYQESLLDDFFRFREHNRKACVFVSNCKKDDMDVTFGEGLRILLGRSCVELTFTDEVP